MVGRPTIGRIRKPDRSWWACALGGLVLEVVGSGTIGVCGMKIIWIPRAPRYPV
jgi:hypothetical protein